MINFGTKIDVVPKAETFINWVFYFYLFDFNLTYAGLQECLGTKLPTKHPNCKKFEYDRNNPDEMVFIFVDFTLIFKDLMG